MVVYDDKNFRGVNCRKKKWFSYISNEKKHLIYNETKRDIDFFNKER